MRERLSYVCSMKDFRQIIDDLEERVFQSVLSTGLEFAGGIFNYLIGAAFHVF